MPGQIEPRIHGMKFGNSFCTPKPWVLVAFHGHPPGSTQGGPCHGVSFFEARQFGFEILAVLAVLQGKSLSSRKGGNYQEIFQ
jgi:hypothetical protein